MAETNRRSVDGAKRRAPKTRKSVVETSPPAREDRPETEPLRETVDSLFRNDQAIAEAVKANLETRTVAASSIAKRATEAFAKFSPSSRSKEERNQRTYLSPQDDLASTLDFVAKKGARALKEAGSTGGIRLARSAELDALIKDKRGERASTIGTIELTDLVDYVTKRLGTSPTRRPVPSLPSCNVEGEAERRLAEIESPNGGPASDADEEEAPHEAPATPPADTDPSTVEFVETKVDLLMETVVSPEREVRILPSEDRYLPSERVDEEAIRASIDTFELRDGPSDVTSYHDFTSLQIAFEHVWTEVFDAELETLGRELYQEFVRLNTFAGLDNGDDRTISTVSDLTKLMTDIRELSRLTQDELPPGGTGSGRDLGTRGVPAGANDVRDEVWYQVATGGFIGSDPVEAFLNPVGFAVGFLGDLLAGAQQITWEFLVEGGGRIPGGIDEIPATIEANAVSAGMVEIILTNSEAAGTWKGIDFYELDSTGRTVNVRKISNHPHDTNRLRIPRQQVKNGLLFFGKEITFGAHKAQYFLTELDERLKDRTRVTFNWTKDK